MFPVLNDMPTLNKAYWIWFELPKPRRKPFTYANINFVKSQDENQFSYYIGNMQQDVFVKHNTPA